MGRVTTRKRILKVTLGGSAEGASAGAGGADGTAGAAGPTLRRREDVLAAEEPLEIRLGGRPLSITMRTPGDDHDLVAGFLATEGVLRRPDDIVSMIHCASDGQENTYNVVDVTLAPHVPPPAATLERNFYTTSSCGMCGKASIDAVRTLSPYDVSVDPVRVDAAVLAGLPEAMRGAQRVFERTGGLHAAGLFTADGTLLCLREDVGRHNALDKVIGWALRAGRVPLRGCVVQVSGRTSFELVQKAVMAGAPVLAAVSAPSSLAVDLAAESGLTLVGFSRGSSLNVYTSPERLVTTPAPAARQSSTMLGRRSGA